MSVINFQERFGRTVKDGEKRQTIRRQRDDIEVGTILQLLVWGETVGVYPCVSIEDISIDRTMQVTLNESVLSAEETDQLFQADGFSGTLDAADYFGSSLPFRGKLYKWSGQ